MPINRFQFSDDFVLKSGKVGINTTEPQEKLDVVGTIIADNITASSISNLHTYEGFLFSNHNIDQNITLSSNTTTSLSGEIIVDDDATVTINEEAISSQGNIDSLKVYNTFTIPTGGTEDRPRKVKPGQLYYNKDFASIEFFDGDRWRQVDNTSRSGRGVFGGGSPTTNSTQIQFINIQSTGNAQYFGDLTVSMTATGGCSSSTRGLAGGGDYTGNVNTINYVTITSQGNGIDFGDLTVARGDNSSCSSSTRGIWGGGYNPATPKQTVNVIDYVQISTLGNAVDFGDLIFRSYSLSACSSSTRGLFAGGGIYTEPGPVTSLSTINLINIASTGNATKFGDLSSLRVGVSACSNSTRGLFTGGNIGSTYFKDISFVTLSSEGNTIEFGNLSTPTSVVSSLSSSSRGVFAGGTYSYPARINVIEYTSIQSGGNSIDFGDLITNRSYMASISDSHGGLGGF